MGIGGEREREAAYNFLSLLSRRSLSLSLLIYTEYLELNLPKSSPWATLSVTNLPRRRPLIRRCHISGSPPRDKHFKHQSLSSWPFHGDDRLSPLDLFHKQAAITSKRQGIYLGGRTSIHISFVRVPIFFFFYWLFSIHFSRPPLISTEPFQKVSVSESLQFSTCNYWSKSQWQQSEIQALSALHKTCGA